MTIPTVLLCAGGIVFLGVLGLVRGKGTAKVAAVAPYGMAAISLLALLWLLVNFHEANGSPALQVPGWQLPFAAFSCGLDPLSAFFLIPLFILTTSGALFGPRYFTKGHGPERAHWFFYGLLIAGMIMVLLARNAVLFLLAWEVMSLSSFFLVVSDTRNPETIRAGWIYFITAHIGAAFLLALFFLLSAASGSFDFAAWKSAGIHGRQADIVFLLALVAFGLKAGFIPFHVWLPLAHPAAPSHVSSLMSGIMIKMGIYGILRILTVIAPFHEWWGILLIALGALSGVLGVLFAIGQHDIKRLLAYCSVENIGIVLLGIGLGIVALCAHNAPVAIFGFAGGLLHIVNHSLSKALLFLGAGAVIRQTGTGEMDRLGGLLKTMPKTGFLFLIGAAAICGLPFFNGFIGEIMIYAGGIRGAILASQPALSAIGMIVILSLALMGGLAVACFIKLFGAVFLGEARAVPPSPIVDVPRPMLAGMGLLAALCVGIGMASPLVIPYLIRPALMFVAVPEGGDAQLLSFSKTISVVLALCAFFMIAVYVFIKKLSAKNGPAAVTGTWDCGYSLPDASMQYTASSFSAPIVRYFRRPLTERQTRETSDHYFPATPWSFRSTVDDWVLSKIFVPLFHGFDRMFSWLRWFQNGKTGQYVLYVVVMLVCLIVWKFFL
jgi:hydrogenase-4 component B